MKVLIVEDERLASDRLAHLIGQYDPEIRLAGAVESVKETVDYLKNKPAPDVLLLDIQLSDGVSFDIFKQVNYEGPVIFTTAYDQFALDAFRFFSVDYILKPVTLDALRQAFNKLKLIRQKNPVDYSLLLQALDKTKENYKNRFLGKLGQRLFLVDADKVAYFQAEDKVVYLIDHSGTRYLIDHTLEKLEDLLDPRDFFRINRKYIVRLQAIDCIKNYPGNRLKLLFKQLPPSNEFIVSRERAGLFKSCIH